MDVDSPKTTELDSELDIGSLLIEARNNANLTSQDIADALKLNLNIIVNIEANHFKQELPVAFVRGYVKSYATKVGLDIQPILVAFDEITGVPAPSLKRVESISSFGKKKGDFNSNSSLFKFISTLIILLFVTFAGWQIWSRFLVPLYAEDGALNQETKETKNNNINLSLDADDLNAGDAVKNRSSVATLKVGSSDSSTMTNTNNANEPSPESLVSSFQEIIPVEGNENAPTPIQLESFADHPLSDVTLDFSADCWVKIIDATGEVLAEGVKRDGKHMPLKGVAPIKVILGDPSAVSMSFDNQMFDLSGYRAGRRVQIILE